LAAALLVLPLGQGELFAQQAPPPGQGGLQNNPYSGQYAPGQQPGYGQPQYAQPQYAQPQYAQPQYGQPQYAQPQYTQPQYAQPQSAQPQYAQPQSAQPQYAPDQYAQPQYAPDQQPGYGQPQSAQPQPYGQQPYAQQPYPGSGQTYPQQGYGQEQPSAQPTVQPLSAEQLEQLVAPIALYPDTLVAQVLAASTYPAQVAEADQWRQAQGDASPYEIAGGADVQNWDPSVKALTAFPQVLAEMDGNLGWMTDLGNAYYNQPQDLLEAVQGMRQRAEAAGNLQSTPQEQVSNDQGNLELAPVNPQMVYVPMYNPWGVYGQPISPYPGFSQLGALGSFFGSSPIRYGLGIAMTAFSHTTWGWPGWGLNWLLQSVLFHQVPYSSHGNMVAGRGLPQGGLRAGPAQGAIARMPNSYVGPRGGNNMTPGPGFAGQGLAGQGSARQPDRYAGTRPGEAPNRGYQTPGAGYTRQPMVAYNHLQAPVSRPQPSSRPDSRPPGYGSGFYSGTGQGQGNPSQAYRAPTAGFQRGDSGGRPSGAFMNKGFAGPSGKPAHSNGFHPFGGGHAPKSPSAGKNFSGGHSGGGGHSSAHGSSKGHH